MNHNQKQVYDDLIVGAGLSGATAARLLKEKGHRVLVIEKNPFVGGNVHTEKKDDIFIHVFGAHIFHTSDEEVNSFVGTHCELTPFINSPIANYKGELYHLPFNMNTFHELWGVNTKEEAEAIIEEQRKKEGIVEPKNLEEQALYLGGRDIYEKLIKGYTEKQWGRKCKDLPSSIIKRLPFRYEYNNNYFNDKYQGIPKEGYTALIESILSGIEVITNCDFFNDKANWLTKAKRIIFTGPIDAFFDYKFGPLEYRSLRFETEKKDVDSVLGIPVMNFTSSEEPYTRMIEHKFFDRYCKNHVSTYISKEYPASFLETKIPYYPIVDEKNNALYSSYAKEAEKFHGRVLFLGRLGQYKYLDMDDAIRAAMDLVHSLE